MQKRMDEYLDLDANLREREELYVNEFRVYYLPKQFLTGVYARLKKAFREGYWDDYKGWREAWCIDC